MGYHFSQAKFPRPGAFNDVSCFITVMTAWCHEYPLIICGNLIEFWDNIIPGKHFLNIFNACRTWILQNVLFSFPRTTSLSQHHHLSRQVDVKRFPPQNSWRAHPHNTFYNAKTVDQLRTPKAVGIENAYHRNNYKPCRSHRRSRFGEKSVSRWCYDLPPTCRATAKELSWKHCRALRKSEECRILG